MSFQFPSTALDNLKKYIDDSLGDIGKSIINDKSENIRKTSYSDADSDNSSELAENYLNWMQKNVSAYGESFHLDMFNEEPEPNLLRNS